MPICCTPVVDCSCQLLKFAPGVNVGIVHFNAGTEIISVTDIVRKHAPVDFSHHPFFTNVGVEQGVAGLFVGFKAFV